MPPEQISPLAESYEAKKKYLWVVLGILIITGGAYAYFSFSNKTQVKEVQTEPRDLSSTDFTGWQTYRNDEYGFEFRYPNEWRATASKNDYPELNAQDWYNKKYNNGNSFPYEPDFVNFIKIGDKEAINYLKPEEIETYESTIILLDTNLIELTHPVSEPLHEKTYAQILSTYVDRTGPNCEFVCPK